MQLKNDYIGYRKRSKDLVYRIGDDRWHITESPQDKEEQEDTINDVKKFV